MSYRRVRSRPFIYIFGGLFTIFFPAITWACVGSFPVLKSSCSKLSTLFKALNPQVCGSGRWANLLPRGGNQDHQTKTPPSSLPNIFKHFPPSLPTPFIWKGKILSKGETPVHPWWCLFPSPLAPWPINYPFTFLVLSLPTASLPLVLKYDRIYRIQQMNKRAKLNLLHDNIPLFLKMDISLCFMSTFLKRGGLCLVLTLPSSWFCPQWSTKNFLVVFHIP